MRDDPSVIALVDRVCSGDQDAWNEVIERYAPLLWSICVRYRLERDDIDDVGQSVWLLLVENIAKLREPAALAGWLATTAKHECLRVIRDAHRRDRQGLPPEDQMPRDLSDAEIEHEIIAAELNAALRAAFAELPEGCHQLLSLLISDPAPGYTEISAKLGMPVGSIGPTRARCLGRLRRSRHLIGVLDNQPGSVTLKGTRR
jgi:RNA polymerase sigma factor (sigma-70 family)